MAIIPLKQINSTDLLLNALLSSDKKISGVVKADPKQTISGVVSAQPTQKITGVTTAKPTAKIIPLNQGTQAPATTAPKPSLATLLPSTTNSTPASTLNLNNSQPSTLDVLKQLPAGLSDASNKIVSGAISGEKAVAKSLIDSKLGQKATDLLAKKLSPTPTRLETALNETLYSEPTPTITDYGKSMLPKFAQKGPLPFIAGLGLTALDFTGAGGEKSAIKALVTTKDEAEAFKILRQVNVAEDLAREYAPIIAKTTKEADVTKIIAHIDDIQKTTKTAETAKGIDAIKPSLTPKMAQGTAILPKAENIAKETETGTKIGPGMKERGFITSVKEAKPEFKVAGQYIPRSTDDLSMKAANLIKTDIRTAEKLAMTGTDENAVATAAELIKHYSDEAAKATDEVAKNAFYDKGAEVANTIARKLTEQGRSVQAASILGRLTPEGQLKFAAREIQKYNEGVSLGKKIPELTGEQSKHILDEMDAIGKMADGEDKAIRFQKLQNYIGELVPSPLIKKLTTVWKAGLLTGLKTTGTNIFANLTHFGSEIVKDIPAKVVDSVASLFTGEKTIGGVTTEGIGKGIKEGFEKGWRYIRTGYDERNIATKLDYNKVNFGKGKIGQAVKAYTDGVFRVLGAEDQPFYYGSLARSIADQAKAQAANAKLSGEEAAKFIDNLIQNPTEKMLTYAVKDAETAVFQNKTALGEAAKKIQQIGGGAGEFAVPFGRTPSAVAMQIVNYSPVGILKTIFENVGKGKFDQRLFSQGIGRGITGTGVLALGAELFNKGMVALDRPTGEREQKLWELEGKKPNSIKIGNKWRSVQVLGPLGNVLLVGGHFKQALNNSGSPTDAIGTALAGSAKSFSEQTFLTGINQIVSAINDPQKSASSYIASTLSSVVPTIVGDTARATDTKERRANGILDRLKAKIPGLRETLEPQINVLGKDIQTIGNPLEVMADPTRPQTAITTPVIRELRRLTDAGFPVSPTLLGNKNGYDGLTPKQNTDLWRKAGEITDTKLSSLFGKEKYQNLSDEEKGKAVDDVVHKSQVNARAAMVLDLIQGLTGEKLKAKLSELKKGGLMTKEVYDQVAKMR